MAARNSRKHPRPTVMPPLFRPIRPIFPACLAVALACLTLPAVSPAASASNSQPSASALFAPEKGRLHPEAQTGPGHPAPNGPDAGKQSGKTARLPEKAVPSGNGRIEYERGMDCLGGRLAECDRASGLVWLERSAKAGHTPAMNELGAQYEKENRMAEARHWYEKSAAKNDPEGQYRLAGRLLENGPPDARTAREAFGLISRAAGQNHAKAQFRLAEIYRYGELAEPDAGKALFWYRRSAAQQYLPALTELADIYENGLMDQAADPLLAAQLRDAIGKTAGIPPRPKMNLPNTLAIFWDSVKPFSFLLLLLFFPLLRSRARYRQKQVESGMHLFENGQYELAAPFLMKPWISQYPEGEAMLGEMLALGRGVEKNVAKAMPHLTRPSGENGRAAYLVGALFENGDGVPPNDKEAFFWYERGAELGDGDAMNRLGILYAEGRGVKQDNDKAVGWLEKSAAAGCQNAEATLAAFRHPGR
ncbi:tetratricopeptide repeat protein [Oxalobacter paraformigenes]|nr:tetratricopeptide repeat protein [Oxalobacter paraformigenes]